MSAQIAADLRRDHGLSLVISVAGVPPDAASSRLSPTVMMAAWPPCGRFTATACCPAVYISSAELAMTAGGTGNRPGQPVTRTSVECWYAVGTAVPRGRSRAIAVSGGTPIVRVGKG